MKATDSEARREMHHQDEMARRRAIYHSPEATEARRADNRERRLAEEARKSLLESLR